MKKLLVILVASSLAMSCGSNQKQEQVKQAAASEAKQATIDSMSTANQQQKTIDSLQTVVDEKEKSKQAADERPVVQTQTSSTTTETKKKGWSSTAKGAVIGAGAGGITGAMVAKHKGAGAVVGGLLGAGVGAGTGAVIDGSKKKKDPK